MSAWAVRIIRSFRQSVATRSTRSGSRLHIHAQEDAHAAKEKACQVVIKLCEEGLSRVSRKHSRTVLRGADGGNAARLLDQKLDAKPTHRGGPGACEQGIVGFLAFGSKRRPHKIANGNAVRCSDAPKRIQKLFAIHVLPFTT